MRVAVIVIALVISFPASAEDNRHGYWWKEEAPEVMQLDIPPPEPAKEADKPEFVAKPAPPSEEELLELHPTEVAKLISEYRQNALWKMSPETVGWYYELQDFSRRRARAFMNVTEMTMLQRPELNMNSVYPTTPPGQQARVAQRTAAIEGQLSAERGNAALLLFTRPDCPYCPTQRNMLRYFEQKHGWQVREIDISANPQAAARFSADVVPMTAVIFKGTNDWFPVSVGVESLPKIEESVSRALRHLRGETTPEQFTMQQHQSGGLLDPTRR